jgi:hypothetical protein
MKYALALTICLIPNAAGAVSVNLPCAEYEGVRDHLASKWHEYPVDGGITGEGAGIVEIFASEGGATFTIVVHDPKGKACIVAAGTDWGSVQKQGESL